MVRGHWCVVFLDKKHYSLRSKHISLHVPKIRPEKFHIDDVELQRSRRVSDKCLSQARTNQRHCTDFRTAHVIIIEMSESNVRLELSW